MKLCIYKKGVIYMGYTLFVNKLEKKNTIN